MSAFIEDPDSIERINAPTQSDDYVGLQTNPLKPNIVQEFKDTQRPASFPAYIQRPATNSPAGLLNLDVLQNIFMQHTPEELTESMEQNPMVPYFPDNVASVCCRWRDAALSSPEIWSTTQLIHVAEKPFPWSQIFKRLCLSGELPLTWNISIKGDNWNHFANTIRLIEGIQERFKSLLLVYESEPRMTISNTFPSYNVNLHNMPHLEDLYLQIPSLIKWAEPSAIIIDLSLAKRLKSIYISIPDTRFQLRSNGTPLSFLTSICLNTAWPTEDSCINVDTCMLLLRIAPSLECFEAEIEDTAFPTETSTHPNIRLEWLTEFTLCYRAVPAILRYILQRITLPRLKELKTGMADGGLSRIEGLPSGIPSFVSNSSDLETLHLVAVDIMEIQSTLGVTPKLEYLKLEGICPIGAPGFRELILSLTISPDRNTLCPMLKTIHFKYSDIDLCIEETILMIASRWDLPEDLRHLEEIEIEGCDSVALFVTHPTITRCISQGFNLVIKDFLNGSRLVTIDDDDTSMEGTESDGSDMEGVET